MNRTSQRALLLGALAWLAITTWAASSQIPTVDSPLELGLIVLSLGMPAALRVSRVFDAHGHRESFRIWMAGTFTLILGAALLQKPSALAAAVAGPIVIGLWAVVTRGLRYLIGFYGR